MTSSLSDDLPQESPSSSTKPPKEGEWKGIVPIPALIGLVGEEAAIRLCRFYQGYQVPSILNYLRSKRDAALLEDWLRRGATVAELSAKYGLSMTQTEDKIRVGIRARQEELLNEPK